MTLIQSPHLRINYILSISNPLGQVTASFVFQKNLCGHTIMTRKFTSVSLKKIHGLFLCSFKFVQLHQQMVLIQPTCLLLWNRYQSWETESTIPLRSSHSLLFSFLLFYSLITTFTFNPWQSLKWRYFQFIALYAINIKVVDHPPISRQ